MGVISLNIAIINGISLYASVKKEIINKSQVGQNEIQQSELIVKLTNNEEIIIPLTLSPCIAIERENINKKNIKYIKATQLTSCIFINFNDYEQLEQLYFPELTSTGMLALCNTRITDITGFPKLKRISCLYLNKKTPLSNISGLNKLQKIRTIKIEGDIKLISITGLQSLREIKYVKKDTVRIIEKIIIVKPINDKSIQLVNGYIGTINSVNKGYDSNLNQLIISYIRPFIFLKSLIKEEKR